MPTKWSDMALRLAVATAAAALHGFERSRQNRAIIGFRILGPVALASCVAVQAIVHSGLPQVSADAAGRVVQDVLSGVGFIGVGALIYSHGTNQVHGLATAGSIRVSAAMGAPGALALWPPIMAGAAIALFILLIDPPIERAIRDSARTGAGKADRRDAGERP